MNLISIVELAYTGPPIHGAKETPITPSDQTREIFFHHLGDLPELQTASSLRQKWNFVSRVSCAAFSGNENLHWRNSGSLAPSRRQQRG